MLTIEQKIARGDIIKESKYHPNKIKHIAGQIEFDHAHLIANNMPINICIIGSLSQANLIKKIGKTTRKRKLAF